MVKKIIGISPSSSKRLWSKDGDTYSGAILNSGGLPFLLPPTDEIEDINRILEVCDGILFSGGRDINPKYYNEEILNDSVEIDGQRDRNELLLIKECIRLNKPILGICRGMQVLNVALAGSLYQDLPSQLSLNHRDELGHEIIVEKSSPLYDIVLEERMSVNTYHHQAIKDLGSGLEIMARSTDGLIEAVYMPSKSYVFAYQWHPERIQNRREQKALFDDFIFNC